MKMFRLPLLAFLACLSGGVSAQTYPTRPITMIVPFTAGGPTDVVARIVGEHMSKTLGQQIIIENVVGAGGTTGITRGSQARPDGYTIMMGHMGTHSAAPALYPKLRYNPVTDFEPIGMAAGTPILLVARKDFPPRDLKEFVTYLRTNTAKLNQAHAGAGSVSFTACSLLNAQLKLKFTQVAYRGTGPALNDLVGGQVDFMCDQIVNLVEQVKGGNIKAYAIATSERSPALPNVPTTKEAGLPDYQVTAWNAVFAPKGTSREIVTRLNGALDRALDDANVRKRLMELGGVIPPKAERTPAWLGGFVKSEVARWTPILKATGATGE